MNSKRNYGFTLIELLVVVAIIGILSSIVLASLSTARQKGQDASAKGSMSSGRAAAELYFDNFGDYGNATSTTLNASSYGTGDALSVPPNDICSYEEVVNLSAAASKQTGHDVSCDTTTTPAGYTLWLQMNDNRLYCVDSRGFAGYLPDGQATPTTPGASCL